MLPHLSVKVDFDLSIFREILDFMLDEKNDIAARPAQKIGRPTGEILGHDIHWRIKDDPRSIPGSLTFEFDSEEDKILFILRKL